MNTLLRLRHVRRVLFGICLFMLPAAPSYAYIAFYVFGDSLSDVGNVHTASAGLIPGSPYYDGRFSNGPNWADDVSASLGLGPLVPLLKGGTDYAFASATASSAVPGSYPFIPNVLQQVALFNLLQKGHADPAALYSVWIGSNDVIDALLDIGTGSLTLAQAKIDLAASAVAEVAALQSLVGDGATHLLVGLVPDIGVTPLFNATAPDLARGLSAFYDTQLVDAAGAVIPGGDLTYFDTFKLLDEAKADPAAFGLTNATNNCYSGPYTGGGSVCSDPDDYLFWDMIHPTRIGHDAVARLALESLLADSVAAVPLPASAPLLATALMTLGFGVALTRRAASKSRHTASV